MPASTPGCVTKFLKIPRHSHDSRETADESSVGAALMWDEINKGEGDSIVTELDPGSVEAYASQFSETLDMTERVHEDENDLLKSIIRHTLDSCSGFRKAVRRALRWSGNTSDGNTLLDALRGVVCAKMKNECERVEVGSSNLDLFLNRSALPHFQSNASDSLHQEIQHYLFTQGVIERISGLCIMDTLVNSASSDAARNLLTPARVAKALVSAPFMKFSKEDGIFLDEILDGEDPSQAAIHALLLKTRMSSLVTILPVSSFDETSIGIDQE